LTSTYAPRGKRVLLAAMALCALFAVLASDASAAKKKAAGEKLTVMTRNIYLGGDIAAPVGATSRADFEQRAAALLQTVEKTNFPARAKLLAAEIKKSKADLIGLQEVALWRRGPDGLRDGPTTPATTVVYDFLKILQRELKAKKLKYRVGSTQNEADLEVPTSLGYDGRLTMRDVILVRKRKGLKVKKKGGKNYTNQISIPTQGGQFTVKRGYSYVDVRLKKKKLRFVNTHLESFLADNRNAQATQLVGKGGPLRKKTPTVLVGDINSDPFDDESDSGAYKIITEGGMKDSWRKLYGTKRANSCCLNNEDLSDTTAAGFDHFIDHTFYKGKIKPLKATTVGNTIKSRKGGLWPSDHGGSYTRLLLR